MKNSIIAIMLLIVIGIQSCSIFKGEKNSSVNKWSYNESSNNIANKKPKLKIPKDAKELLKGMKYIIGGVYTSGLKPNDIIPTDFDSTLIIDNNVCRITVPSFYLCDHEVTNAEYREFTNWVKNRVARELLASKYPELINENGTYNENIPIDWKDTILIEKFYYPLTETLFNEKYKIDTRKLIFSYYQDSNLVTINIYPDTTVWHELYDNYDMYNYFWHPKFDNYPVVGVSYKQTLAYCAWRTDRVNEKALLSENILKNKSYYFTTKTFLEKSKNSEHKKYLYNSFRLPTSEEWEYAAAQKKFTTEKPPLEDYGLVDNKGKYIANFGGIFDKHNFPIKYYHYSYTTTEVKSFTPNSFKLCDMAGNVAEWTCTKADIVDLFNYNSTNSNTPYYEKIVEKGKMDKVHNEKVLKNQHPAKIVKGGSWADPPIYLIPSTKTIFNENRSSNKIGFRVAMNSY